MIKPGEERLISSRRCLTVFSLFKKMVSASEDEEILPPKPVVEVDVTSLHSLSPEVISKQATINIGTIGHVAHGKSTVVKAISGVQVKKNSLPPFF